LKHLKIIHIVENLDRNAVENWLVRMLRFGVNRGVLLDWTFYCTLGMEGQLDEEVQKLGARIIYSPVPLSSRGAFLRALRRELRDGRYDVMHCHHDLVSAIYLLASIRLPMCKRIVHVHNADECVPTPNRLKAWLFRPVLRRVCLAMADRIVGISNHTLDTFLAGRRRRPGRDIVHYYGVDSSQFEAMGVDRVSFRRQLGLADHSRILLFTGRIVPEKNPLFAIEVFAQMHRIDPAFAGLIVGTGSLDEAVRHRASELGLGAAFRHLGWRNDVTAIMRCCDLFILPHPEHPMEGFGLAVVEAQLAGLRLLLSQGVSDDPLLPTAVCRRLSLAAGRHAWAEAALDLLHGPEASPAEALKALEQSPFEMAYALRHLQSLHGVG
jgi:glycosyltransferase involved in cell wall biosynthesis